MRRFVLPIMLLLLLFLLACKTDKTAQDWKNQFHIHYPHLKKLVSRLQGDPILDSLFHIPPYTGLPDIAAQYPSVLKLLQHVGITEASAHGCARNKWRSWYYLKTNWPSTYPIYIVHDITESIKSEKKFYERDAYGNETWGLGDNWYMFRFVKTIEDAKQ